MKRKPRCEFCGHELERMDEIYSDGCTHCNNDKLSTKIAVFIEAVRQSSLGQFLLKIANWIEYRLNLRNPVWEITGEASDDIKVGEVMLLDGFMRHVISIETFDDGYKCIKYRPLRWWEFIVYRMRRWRND